MIDFAKLREPFPPDDIEWRLQECGKKGDKIWAMCLAYLTNRAIMQRLDDVCSPENWKNEYKAGPMGGIICGLSIRCGDEWVCKWDGADNTAVEATKGGLSDAMKRAGVQWGIGRYLYHLDAGFATIAENGEYRGKTKTGDYFKWNAPKLPAWALPPNSPPAQKKESPPLPDETKKEEKKEETPAVNKALLDELAAHCQGDLEKMDTVLKRITHYESAGKEYSFGLDKLPAVSEKWAGKALTALRKHVMADTEANSAANNDGVCPECGAPLIEGRCSLCPY